MYKNHLMFSFTAGTMLEIKIIKALSPDSLTAVASDTYTIDRKNCNFYLPDVEIPRFKRKVFADDNKMKNTNMLAKADCIIINPFSKFNKYNNTTLFEYEDHARIKTETFLGQLRSLAEYGYASDKVIKKVELLSKTNPYIYATANSKYQFTEELANLASLYTPIYEYDDYPFIISSELEDLFQINPNLKFFTQRAVQQCLSDAGIVIDVNKYKELCKLIDTNDRDNVILAMEIMANSNYAKSIIYIYMLLFKRGKLLGELGNTSHVNFLNMLHYFNLGNNEVGEEMTEKDVEIIFKNLKEHGQFTKANANMFLNFYNNEKINVYHRGTATNNHLRLNKDAEVDINDEHEIVDTIQQM